MVSIIKNASNFFQRQLFKKVTNQKYCFVGTVILGSGFDIFASRIFTQKRGHNDILVKECEKIAFFIVNQEKKMYYNFSLE